MKLKFVGMICPDCGEEIRYVGPKCEQDTWIGYTRMIWCIAWNHCEHRAWILLFDKRKRFVGIVAGDDSFLRMAGNRIYDVDEIPF